MSSKDHPSDGEVMTIAYHRSLGSTPSVEKSLPMHEQGLHPANSTIGTTISPPLFQIVAKDLEQTTEQQIEQVTKLTRRAIEQAIKQAVGDVIEQAIEQTFGERDLFGRKQVFKRSLYYSLSMEEPSNQTIDTIKNMALNGNDQGISCEIHRIYTTASMGAFTNPRTLRKLYELGYEEGKQSANHR